MKKIILAFMVSIIFAGAGFCAPAPKGHGSVAPPPHSVDVHHKKHDKHRVAPPPPPPVVHNVVAVRRHKHHVPIYPYDYYPNGTQVIVNTGGISVGYSTAYGGYINYGGFINY